MKFLVREKQVSGDQSFFSFFHSAKTGKFANLPKLLSRQAKQERRPALVDDFFSHWHIH